MTKKWYDFFVVTERPADAKGAPARPTPPGKASAPKRAGELAPGTETTFAKPVADPTVFDEIYSAARIATPAHGFTILKVAEMLASEHLRELPPDVKRKSILVALDAARVSVDSVVEDAVQRDRALDTYEKVLEKTVTDLRAASDAENRGLEKEIEQQVAQLRAKIDANNRHLREEEASLATWRDRKQAEENRIADAVRHFVSENPVTTAVPPSTHGGGHVRENR
jgi:hypothetical protein